MPEGPFGGPRPFIRDKRTVLVLIGVDHEKPPPPVQANLREIVNLEINNALIDRGANITKTRSTVELTVEEATNEQKRQLGYNTIHVQQYDVKTELEEISQGLINAIHNTVVERVAELDFNVVGVKTTVV